MFQVVLHAEPAGERNESIGPYSHTWKDYTGGPAGGDAGDRRHVLTVNYTFDIPSVAKLLNFNNPVGKAILPGGAWAICSLM